MSFVRNFSTQIPDDEDGIFRKDCLFFTINNFVGGLQSCSVILLKKSLIDQSMASSGPARKSHSEILSVIRAGMAVQLKEAVGAKFIMRRERKIADLARGKLAQLQDFVLLGNFDDARLGILNFAVKHSTTGEYT